MPYHIKKKSKLGSAVPTNGDEYYAGNNHWTNVYENRKVYTNKVDADAIKETVITKTLGGTTYSYTPTWFLTSTVVEE